LLKYRAFGENYDPYREKDEQEIVLERPVLHPPSLQVPFVGRNNGIIKIYHISLGLVHQVFLIAKIDGSDSGKTGPNLADLCLVFFSKHIVTTAVASLKLFRLKAESSQKSTSTALY
jgi:hypothetical protein